MMSVIRGACVVVIVVLCAGIAVIVADESVAQFKLYLEGCR